MVTGKGNTSSTDVILKKLLNVNSLGEYYQYKTWDDTYNIITIYRGKYTHLVETVDFILFIKQFNYGKRDSLVLARKLCYNYNNKILTDPMISKT
jgi:hypothetical protein